MRGVVLVMLASACGRLGFDPRATSDASPLAADAARDVATDSSMIGSDGAGSASLAPLQNATAITGNGTQTVTLPAPTAAGSVLVATVGLNNIGVLTVPSGWVMNTNSTINGSCVSAIMTETSGAAGRQSFTFTLSANAPVALQLSEWGGADLANAFDTNGNGGSSFSMTALSISTSAATTTAGDLAIAAFCEDVAAPTFTAGAGWTELGQAPGASATPSLFSVYQKNAPLAVVTATGTSSLVAKYAATIVTLRPM